MRTYPIDHCIRTYGADTYLRGLRRRYAAGAYTRAHFAYFAARAYLAAGKPRRASALLQTLDPTYAPSRRHSPVWALAAQTHSAPPSPRPQCSLNMIVRNEQETLGPALDSVDTLMDEVVVCDTGSTDRTVEIARLYGAKVVHFAWCDDFSAARNHAIEASSCQWILWMDADDRLPSPSRTPLVELWRSFPPQCAFFCIANEKNGTDGNRFLQARLFPRRDDLRFERRIHEQIANRAQRIGLPITVYDNIRIIHTGYDNEQTHQRKAARNKPLIAAEIATDPLNPLLHLNLGDACMILEEYEEACQAYGRALAIEGAYESNPDVYVQSTFYLALGYYKRGEFREARRYLLRCLYMDSSRAEAYLLLATVCKETGAVEQACDWYARSVAAKPRLRITATNNQQAKAQAYYGYSELLLERRDYASAQRILTEGTATFPQAPGLHTLQGKLHLEQGDLVEAARNYMRSIAMWPGDNALAYTGMARIYEILGDSVKANEFARKADTISPASSPAPSQTPWLAAGRYRVRPTARCPAGPCRSSLSGSTPDSACDRV